MYKFKNTKQKISCHSNIKDHRTTKHIQEKQKICNYWKNYQNVTQRHDLSKWGWENGTDVFDGCRVARNLQLGKKKQTRNPHKNMVSENCSIVKCNKRKSACR